MTQTFTLDLDLTAKQNEKEFNQEFDFAGPSEQTIQNILNFSRNLEVKKSEFLKSIELLKS